MDKNAGWLMWCTVLKKLSLGDEAQGERILGELGKGIKKKKHSLCSLPLSHVISYCC